MNRIIAFLGILAATSPVAASHQSDNVGVFDPASGEVLLNTTHTGGSDDEAFYVEAPGSTTQLYPVGGAFELDNLHGIAVYNQASRIFHIRHAHNDDPGNLVVQFPSSTFLGPGGTGIPYPVAGDWDGDGIDTIGVFFPSTGVFYLRNSNSAGPADIIQAVIGLAGSDWRPVAGDWDGDGIDSIGAFHQTTKEFRLRNQHTSGSPSYTFTFQGLPVGIYYPIAGDWDALDGETRSMVGVYRQQDSRFYMKYQLASGAADFDLSYGPGGQRLPIAGDWDGKALRFAVPLSVAGDRFRSFPHLVKPPGAPSLDFDFYYTVSTADTTEKIMYNRYQNDAWQFSVAQEILATDNAVAVGTVLISTTHDFPSPNGPSYKRLMYYVYEPSEKPPGEIISGWVCLMYSNDGIDWTEPIMATRTVAAVPPACIGNGSLTEQIASEMVGGFRVGADLWLGAMNGRVRDLVDGANVETQRTETYLYYASLSTPWVMTLQGEFSPLGIERPNTGGRWNYAFGFNLDFTYDPDEQSVYFTRAYPYPLDSGQGFPCNNPSTMPRCNTGYFALPIRTQVYRMSVPSGTAQEFLQGTWELVADHGSSVGYRDDFFGSCENETLAFPYQEALGVDPNSVKFYKDHNGQIDLSELGARYLAFGASPKLKVHGDCEFGRAAMYVLPADF